MVAQTDIKAQMMVLTVGLVAEVVRVTAVHRAGMAHKALGLAKQAQEILVVLDEQMAVHPILAAAAVAQVALDKMAVRQMVLEVLAARR